MRAEADKHPGTVQERYEKPAIAWEEAIDLGPALALACGKFPGDQFCKNVGGGFRLS